MLARGVPLFPENDNDSFNFVGDHDILGESAVFRWKKCVIKF